MSTAGYDAPASLYALAQPLEEKALRYAIGVAFLKIKRGKVGKLRSLTTDYPLPPTPAQMQAIFSMTSILLSECNFHITTRIRSPAFIKNEPSSDASKTS